MHKDEIQRVADLLVHTAMEINHEQDNIAELLQDIEHERAFGPLLMNMGAATYQASLPLYSLLRKLGTPLAQLGSIVKDGLSDTERGVFLSLMMSQVYANAGLNRDGTPKESESPLLQKEISLLQRLVECGVEIGYPESGKVSLTYTEYEIQYIVPVAEFEKTLVRLIAELDGLVDK